MKPSIQIKLFASLGRYMPESSDAFPIDPGLSVRDLALGLGVPLESAKLIFVNGQKRDLVSCAFRRRACGHFPAGRRRMKGASDA